MIRKILIVLAISLSFAACNQEAETNKAKPSDTVPAAPSPAVTQAPPALSPPALNRQIQNDLMVRISISVAKATHVVA